MPPSRPPFPAPPPPDKRAGAGRRRAGALAELGDRPLLPAGQGERAMPRSPDPPSSTLSRPRPRPAASLALSHGPGGGRHSLPAPGRVLSLGGSRSVWFIIPWASPSSPFLLPCLFRRRAASLAVTLALVMASQAAAEASPPPRLPRLASRPLACFPRPAHHVEFPHLCSIWECLPACHSAHSLAKYSALSWASVGGND